MSLSEKEQIIYYHISEPKSGKPTWKWAWNEKDSQQDIKVEIFIRSVVLWLIQGERKKQNLHGESLMREAQTMNAQTWRRQH